jgi:outer membrane protein W
MKKLIISLLTVTTLATSTNAQQFEQGRNFVSAGYGIGIGYGAILKAYQSYAGYDFNGFGPVLFNYERGVTDNIGIGLCIGYSTYGATWNYSSLGLGSYDYKYSWNTLSIMARGTYHFDMSRRSKFDPYVGVGLGYRNYSFKWTSSDPDFSEANYNISLGIPFGFQLFGGARYMFNDNVGAYAEVGYGISVANAGLTLAF